jgi:hypothetical protein
MGKKACEDYYMYCKGYIREGLVCNRRFWYNLKVFSSWWRGERAEV